jgi:hypothetical protein
VASSTLPACPGLTASNTANEFMPRKCKRYVEMTPCRPEDLRASKLLTDRDVLIANAGADLRGSLELILSDASVGKRRGAVRVRCSSSVRSASMMVCATGLSVICAFSSGVG